MDKNLNDSRIETIVGSEMYTAWVDMLKTLGPSGRTHRLAVLVASMLRCAHQLSIKTNFPLSDSFETTFKSGVYEKVLNELYPLVCDLLTKSQIKWERVNSKGQRYDLAEESIRQFFLWDQMPWE